jgi:hypothetical protein
MLMMGGMSKMSKYSNFSFTIPFSPYLWCRRIWNGGGSTTNLKHPFSKMTIKLE